MLKFRIFGTNEFKLTDNKHITCYDFLQKTLIINDRYASMVEELSEFYSSQY